MSATPPQRLPRQRFSFQRFSFQRFSFQRFSFQRFSFQRFSFFLILFFFFSPTLGLAETPTTLPQQALQEKDHQKRAQALDGLAKQKDAAIAAIPAISKLLQDEKPYIRQRAANLLATLGKPAAAAIPALLTATEGKMAGFWESTLRSTVIDALAALGRYDLPAMKKALQDKAWSTRRIAAFALGKMGAEAAPALPLLIALHADEHGSVVYAASYSLKRLCKVAIPHTSAPHAALPLLIDALAHPHSSVRKAAAEALGLFGEKAHNAIPKLTPLLEDKDTWTRRAAEDTLGRFGKKGQFAMHRYALSNANPQKRSQALLAILAMKLPASDTYPIFSRALQDKERVVLEAAFKGLTSLGREAKPALPALQSFLNHEEIGLRLAAIEAIAALAQDALPALPSLLARASYSIEKNFTILRALDKAIQSIGQPAIPALIALLADEKLSPRASSQLSRFRQAAIPALLQAIRSPHPLTRKGATDALSNMGTPAILPLIQALQASCPPPAR
jgi:HEAT repeat protein